VIDIGGRESTLVDDLLATGYENITVLDVPQTAVDATRKRLGLLAKKIGWIVGDITQVRKYDSNRSLTTFGTTVEPHTEIIRKGKASKPNEFGKLVKVQEAENQIVTHSRQGH
jgi:hypothetical protein